MNYILVQWPESQDLMEYDWFQEEAILDNSENAISSSYFIPEERIIEVTSEEYKNSLIMSRIKELSKHFIGKLDEEALNSDEPWLGIDMTDEEHIICIRDGSKN